MEQFIRQRLKDLSQGARIAYVRQLRGMTQDELAGKLGFTDDRRRRHITRYETNERIRQISCDKVYELITGDPDALKKTYEALPKAIADILDINIEFSDNDQILLAEFKDDIFNNSD